MSIIKVRDNAKHDDFTVGDVNDKNLIINGAMNVWQRGISKTGITSAGYYTVDRWKTDVINAGTWTQSQEYDGPSEHGFAVSLKLDCTSADSSLAAGDRLFYSHRIEDQNCSNLKKGTSATKSTTASFWVKSNKTGTYICELFDSHNSRHINESYTIDSANTWEKKTITFAGDTSGAFANDNGIGLMLQFWLAAGSDYTSGTLQTSWGSSTNANRAVGQVNLADSTSNEFYITGVQLEAGTTATSFEHEPYGDTIIKCQRYFFAYGNYGTGNTTNNRRYSSRYGGGASFVHIHYPEKIRVIPTLNYSISGGAVSTDYSTRTGAQLYDSDDTGFYVYDFTADGEL